MVSLQMIDTDEFSIERPLPGWLRAGLAATGLFCIVTPAWEFRHVFLHPDFSTLFFGFLTLGAWTVGGGFILAAWFGEDQRWRVRDGVIDIERTRVGWRSTTAVRRENLREMRVRFFPDDDGPDVYRVVLALESGEEFESPAFEKSHNAEELAARLRRRLHLE
ncbi:hypothetical protein [Methylocystis sp. ATCC 49242]|uniref:hypothetical protein n=1 Tax=Methylocystis sp. ATCC 49242 TaxID=622637 RepID=UPI0001F86D01|nr:hypothetical protein [Methylocystis sp. ATCC 49242]